MISLSLLVASEDKGVLTMDFVDSAWFRSVCYAGVSLFYVVKQYDYADLLGVRAVEKREEWVSLFWLSYFGNLNIRLPASEVRNASNRVGHIVFFGIMDL